MFNTHKLESRDGNAIKESKKVKNSSNFENLEIVQEKNKTDFKPVVEIFESHNYMPNTFLPASNTKCLHTGIHGKELFECLRKETSDPLSEMKKDITAFCSNAAKTADIKEGNSKFDQDVAIDISIKDAQQSIKYKSMKKNNDFEQYNNMIEANTCHRYKILQKNGNLRNHNCAAASIVGHEDDDDFVEDSSKTGFQQRSLVSNNEAKIAGKEIDLESRKNKETEQNNAENSEAIKMLSLKNDAQSVPKKSGHDLSSQIIGTKRKRSKEVHDHKNDLTKKTIHHMINSARSRRKNIK